MPIQIDHLGRLAGAVDFRMSKFIPAGFLSFVLMVTVLLLCLCIQSIWSQILNSQCLVLITLAIFKAFECLCLRLILNWLYTSIPTCHFIHHRILLAQHLRRIKLCVDIVALLPVTFTFHALAPIRAVSGGFHFRILLNDFDFKLFLVLLLLEDENAVWFTCDKNLAYMDGSR